MKRMAFGILLMLFTLYAGTIMVNASSATDASVVISPNTTIVPLGSSFVLNLTINNVVNMRAWDIVLIYGNIITLNSVDTINDTIFTDGAGLAIVKPEDYNSSYYFIDIGRTTLSIVPGSGTGSGLVAQLHFTAASNGIAPIYFVSSEIMNSNMVDITPITVATPTITIATAPPPPPPSTVGGWSFSVVKAVSSASYIGLAAALIAVIAIIATAIYFRGIKRRKEKQ